VQTPGRVERQVQNGIDYRLLDESGETTSRRR
jgi:hypothetical protein